MSGAPSPTSSEVLRSHPLRRHMFRHVAAFLIFVCAVEWLYGPVIWHWSTEYIGLGSDPMLFMWYLTWLPFALTHVLNPLVSNWIFFGSGISILWNTSVPLLGATVGWTADFWGPIGAYNLAALVSLLASCGTAYYAAYRLTGRQSFLGSVLCGLLYGFSPFSINQMAGGHLHLVASFITPLLVLQFYEVLVWQRRAWPVSALLLASLFFAQFWVSEEVFATDILLAAIAVVVLTIATPAATRKARTPVAARTLLLAIVTLVALLGVFVFLQLTSPHRPAGPIQPADVYVTDLLNFFIPTPMLWLAGSATTHVVNHFTGNGSEWDGYVGIPLILLLIHVIHIRWQDKLVRVFGFLAVVAALLSMGPKLHVDGYLTKVPLPWAILGHLPLFGDVLPNRLMNYTFLMAGLMVAAYLRPRLSQSSEPRALRIALVSVALIFLIPRLPLPATTPANPPLFAGQHKVTFPSPVLVIPYSMGLHATAMLWQSEARMGFKMVEGYAANAIGPNLSPPATVLTAALINIEEGAPATEFPGAQLEIRGLLTSERVKTIVVGPSAHEAEARRFIDNLLGMNPRYTGGVFVWGNVQRLLGQKAAIYVGGQVFPDGWVGGRINIETFNRPMVCTLSAQSRPVAAGPVTVRGLAQTFTVGPGQDHAVRLPKHAHVKLAMSPTFVPNVVEHNGDTRLLTLVVECSPT